MVWQWPFQRAPTLDFYLSSSTLALWRQRGEQKEKDEVKICPTSSVGLQLRGRIQRRQTRQLTYACVAFSAHSQSKEKQSRVTSGGMREAREKNLLSTSSHMDKNTDGENRKSGFLQAFINLMSSSRKMSLQRDCQQVVYKICRATKKVFNL